VPGADVDRITGALAHRMCRRFFKGVLPYGGPCWPRDNIALSVFMETIGMSSQLPRTVDASNAEHGRFVLRKVLDLAPHGCKVGVMGACLQTGHYVIERSYSIDLVGWLVAEGRAVLAWDPQATDESRKVIDKDVTFCTDAESCLAQSHVAVIAVPLPQLAAVDWSRAKNVTVIDCWHALPPAAQQAVDRYVPLGIGRDEDKTRWINHFGANRFAGLTK
jgi:UDPglucose 6-dehydrogenase